MTREQEDQLDELLERESGLYSREVDFIDDLDQKWRERDLTEKQADWLGDIHKRLCSRRKQNHGRPTVS